MFPGVPARDVLKISCDPADLHDIVASALRAYSVAAERTVLNLFDDGMVAVAVIKGTHDLKCSLTTVWAGSLIHYKVACVALVSPILYRDIVQAFVFLS